MIDENGKFFKYCFFRLFQQSFVYLRLNIKYEVYKVIMKSVIKSNILLHVAPKFVCLLAQHFETNDYAILLAICRLLIKNVSSIYKAKMYFELFDFDNKHVINHQKILFDY